MKRSAKGCGIFTLPASWCEVEKYAWLPNSRRTQAMAPEKVACGLGFGMPGGAAPVHLSGREPLPGCQRHEDKVKPAKASAKPGVTRP
jgi:hypothetical protein